MPPPLIALPASAQNQRDKFVEAYAVLEQAIAARIFPGAAFGVYANGHILVLDGVGQFTYSAGSPTVTAGTVYDLASVTKVIATTSMAVILSQQGKLRLDDPLAAILPAFAQGDAARQQVTLRLLLAHASGLPGYARLFEQAGDRQELLNACLALPLVNPPGRHAEYSDPGFVLLGQALEVLAGESIDRFCAREVFTPLGMTSTLFRPPADWRDAIPPTEEDVSFRHRVIQGEVQDENGFMLGGASGHAGLFSNALDPLLYAQCVLGEPGTPQIFSPATIALFTRRAEVPEGSSRALGWDTPSSPSSSGRFFSRHSAGHLGYAGTSLWIDFERKIAVVLLTNRTWPRRGSERIREVRPSFHDCVMKALGAATVQRWD